MNPIWLAIVASLIGGGAMGAFISNYFRKRQSRRQPVVFTTDIIHIFRKGQNFPRLAKLMVTEHPLGTGLEKPVDNLSLARISVTNKGNQDIEEFAFGITMEGTYKIVDFRMKDPDRHHVMKIGMKENIPLVNPDFWLTPFNRGDTYAAEIYFIYDKLPGPIKLSTAHPVDFIDRSLIPLSDGLYITPTPQWLRIAVRVFFFLMLSLMFAVIFIPPVREFLKSLTGLPLA